MKTKEDILSELESVIERLKHWDAEILFDSCYSGVLPFTEGDSALHVKRQLVITWQQPIYIGG